MDIKLTATLSAYSKVDSMAEASSSIATVTREQIDSLFVTQVEHQAVTKSHIDSLFTKGSVSNNQIDQLFN